MNVFVRYRRVFFAAFYFFVTSAFSLSFFGCKTTEVAVKEEKKESKQWNGITFNVMYNPGMGDGQSQIREFPYGKKEKLHKLDELGFTAPIGLKFSGWALSSDGEVAYREKDKFMVPVDGAFLYAKWEEKDPHKLEFGNVNPDDVVAGGEELPDEYYESRRVILPVLESRTGYAFDGWSGNEAGIGTIISGWNPGEHTEDMILYAKWSGIPYKIIYEANGGELAAGSPDTHVYGTRTDLKEASRHGYVFAGWYGDENFEGKSFNSLLPYESTEDIHLYARWQGEVFSITYNLGDGTSIGRGGLEPYGRGRKGKRSSDENGEGIENFLPKTHTFGKETFLGMPSREGYRFEGWFDNEGCQGKAISSLGAEDFDHNIELWAKWKDMVPPSDVKNVHSVSGLGSVELYWQNPPEDDFVKAEVTFLDRTVVVDKGSNVVGNPEDNMVRKTIDNLENGVMYDFTIKCFDADGNVSPGVVESKFAGNGVFLGNPYEDRGSFDIESVEIDGKTLSHSGTIVVVPEGQTVYVQMVTSDSWNEALEESAAKDYKGIFQKGMEQTLNPYSIGQYPVTQELFREVMEKNPSNFNSMLGSTENYRYRPVENVNWYHAIVFCNKLTLFSGGSEEDLCYSIEGIDDWASLTFDDIPKSEDSLWDNVVCDFSKGGYRLPTEAEWEFAAHGGDMNSDEWKKTFSGMGIEDGKMIFDGVNYISTCQELDEVCWYNGNANGMSHESGLKKCNALNIYDMTGNVWEWCWDWYKEVYAVDEESEEPSSVKMSRVNRGGSWFSYASICTVSYRGSAYPYIRNPHYGFRIARSLVTKTH